MKKFFRWIVVVVVFVPAAARAQYDLAPDKAGFSAAFFDGSAYRGDVKFPSYHVSPAGYPYHRYNRGYDYDHHYNPGQHEGNPPVPAAPQNNAIPNDPAHGVPQYYDHYHNPGQYDPPSQENNAIPNDPARGVPQYYKDHSCVTWTFTNQTPNSRTEDIAVPETVCEFSSQPRCGAGETILKRRVTVNLGDRRLEPGEAESLKICLLSEMTASLDLQGMLYDYEVGETGIYGQAMRETVFNLAAKARKPAAGRSQ